MMKTHVLPAKAPSAHSQHEGSSGFTSPHSHDLISAVEAAPAPSAYPVQMRLPSAKSSARDEKSDKAIGRDHDQSLRRLCARIYYHE